MSRRKFRNGKGRARRRQPGLERLECRRLLNADWQNPLNLLDVNDDGVVEPLDALQVVNAINDGFGIGTLPVPTAEASPPPYVDVDGNCELEPLDVLLIINAINRDSAGPAMTIGLVSDTAPNGSQNNDDISSESMMTGGIVDPLGIASLSIQLNAGDPQVLTPDADGLFVFDPTLAVDGSADGPQRVVLRALDGIGNQSELTYSWTQDSVANNQFGVEPKDGEGPLSIDIHFAEAVDANAFDAANYALTIEGGANDGQAVALMQAEQLGDATVRLHTATALVEGQRYGLTVSEVIGDVAGNLPDSASQWSFVVSASFRLNEISPKGGDSQVSLTREAIFRFSEPLDAATIDNDTVQVMVGTEPIDGRLVVSSTGLFVTFYPDDPWPSSTRVRLVVDGDQVRSTNGAALDADRDGVAGGTFEANFHTLSVTPIPGTEVFGFVRDSMTGEPIVGATIRVDALASANSVTDENGRFQLTDVPAPIFFVHVDGSTSTSAAAGHGYPNVGKPFHSVPGESVQLHHHGEVFDVFLPLMSESDTQTLSAVEATDVGFGDFALTELETILPGVPASELEKVSVTFLPAAAVDDQGNPATTASIIPVPPDRLPSPLPEGVDPSLVISIQAAGAESFDIPAPITFPNLDNLAIGARPAIWSFDHDAGRFRPIGTGIVVDDGAGGTVVESAPGVGILAPGWHFLSPELNWLGPEGEPLNNYQLHEQDPVVDFNLYHTTHGPANTLRFRFEAPGGSQQQEGVHDPPSGNLEPSRHVEITVSDSILDLYKSLPNEGEPLESQSFVLYPGDEAVEVFGRMRTFDELFDQINDGIPFEYDQLIGGRISIVETVMAADHTRIQTTREILPYLYVDALDDDFADGVLKYPDTVITGDTFWERELSRQFSFGDYVPIPSIDLSGAAVDQFENTPSGVRFAPSRLGDHDVSLGISIELDGTVYNSAQQIPIESVATPKQKVFLNQQGIEDQLLRLQQPNNKHRIDLRYANDNPSQTYQLNYDSTDTAPIPLTASAAEVHQALVTALGIPATDLTVELGRDAKTTTLIFGGNPLPATRTVYEVEFVAGRYFNTANLLRFRFNGAGLMSVTPHWFTIPPAELALFDDPMERQTIAQDMVSHIRDTIFADFHDGIEFVNTRGTDTVNVVWTSTGKGGRWGASTTNVGGDGIDNLEDINAVVANRENDTPAAQNFRMYEAINQSIGSDVEVYLDTIFDFFDVDAIPLATVTPTESIIGVYGKTTSHEIAHVWGAHHTHNGDSGTDEREINIDGAVGGTDIMRRGPDLNGTRRIQPELTGSILRIALDLGWEFDDAQRVISFYTARSEPGNGFDSHISDEEIEGHAVDGAHLALFDERGHLLSTPPIAFGSVVEDGLGSQSEVQSFRLRSFGTEDVTIEQLTLVDPSEHFQLTPIEPGTVIEASTELGFEVTFDPTTIGDVVAELILESTDEQKPLRVYSLSGRGITAEPDLELNVIRQNNNLGGVELGTTKTITNFLEVSNRGGEELVFTFDFVIGADEYRSPGVAGVEQSLSPGDKLVVPLEFDPTTLGLLRGVMQFTSNDPNDPLIEQGVIATGIANEQFVGTTVDWGEDYVMLTQGPFTERMVSNRDGYFEAGFGTRRWYQQSVFDPASGLIAHGGGWTGVSGALTNASSGLNFKASTEMDGDNDGLPNDVERTAGLNIHLADSDGDGVDDFQALTSGITPLLTFNDTGFVGAVDLRGTPTGSAVGRSVMFGGEFDFIGTSTGMSIVEFTNPTEPIVVSEILITGGVTDVVVDDVRNTVVAAGDRGLHIIDVSRPDRPQETLTIPTSGPASAVETYQGIAVVATGSTIDVIELATSTLVQSFPLPGAGLVSGMAREANRVFAFQFESDTLTSMLIEDDGLVRVLDSTSTPIADNDVDVAVGDGVVTLAGSGLTTVDVSDPSNLTLISTADLQFVARGLAVGPGGLAHVAAEGEGLVLYDISDPSITDNNLAAFAVDGGAIDVRVSGRTALVTTPRGLRVVNFTGVDDRGVPPSVSLTAGGADLDENAPGIQAISGDTIPFLAQVSDDVGVDSVEFLVNGVIELVDGTYPFDAPISLLRPNGATIFEVTARVVDVGGNASVSEAITVQAVPDQFAPEIAQLSPADGGLVPTAPFSIDILLDEPIQSDLLDASTFIVRDANGEVVPSLGIRTAIGDRLIHVDYGAQEPGSYELEIDGSGIVDAAGNALADQSATFSVVAADVFWVGGSGDFHEPENWSTGETPDADDVVLIAAPGNALVSIVSPANVGRLISDDLILLRNRLTTAAESQLYGGMDTAGGAQIRSNTSIVVTGSSRWNGLFIDTTSRVVNQGVATISSASMGVQGTLRNEGVMNVDHDANLNTRFGRIENAAGALWNIRGDILVTHRDDFNSYFENNGIIRKEGGDAFAHFGIGITGTGGRIEVNRGIALFSRGGISTDVTISIAEDAFVEYRDVKPELQGQVTYEGNGTLHLQNGGLRIGEDATAEVNSLVQLDGGDFEINGTVNLHGDVTWNGSSVSGTGELNNYANILLDGQIPRNLINITLNNHGVVNHLTTSRVHLSSAIVTTHADGVWNLLDDVDVQGAIVPDSEFNVIGPLNYGVGGSTGTSFFNVPVHISNQTIEIPAGILYLNKGGVYENVTFNVDDGAALTIGAGDHIMRGNNSLNGSGSANFEANDTTVEADAILTNNLNNGGRLNLISTTMMLDGPLVNNGDAEWRGSVLRGTVNNNGNLVMDNAFTRQFSGVLNNSGVVDDFGTGRLLITDATINNLATGEWYAAAGSFYDDLPVRTSEFINAGLFEKRADGGNVIMDTPFSNSGNILLTSGTTSILGGFTQTAGETVFVDATIATNFQEFLFAGGTLEGVAELTANVTIDGAVLLIGNSDGSPGTLDINGSFTQTAASQFVIDIGGDVPGVDSDFLDVSGAVTLDGELVVAIGAFTPIDSDAFSIITAGSLSGQFATITGDPLPIGLLWLQEFVDPLYVLTAAS